MGNVDTDFLDAYSETMEAAVATLLEGDERTLVAPGRGGGVGGGAAAFVDVGLAEAWREVLTLLLRVLGITSPSLPRGTRDRLQPSPVEGEGIGRRPGFLAGHWKGSCKGLR